MMWTIADSTTGTTNSTNPSYGGTLFIRFNITSPPPPPPKPALPTPAALLAGLGLPATATWPEVKRRYKVLAKKHHPDRGGTQEQMIRLNNSYELLQKVMT